MREIDFNQKHYDQMLVIDEDYRNKSFDEIQEQITKGHQIVKENGGFANLDTKLNQEQMLCVSAFITYRLAKEDLGEYVENIDD